MEVNMSDLPDSIDEEDNKILMSIVERNLKFYLLILLLFASLCCTIFMLYHFNRRRFHSQIYGVLLIINALIIIAELPFTLIFLHEGSITTEKRCVFWIMINYSLFLSSIILMAWTSVERYLFIYHERFIIRHIISLHYIPIIIIILYSIFFYVGTVLLYNCEPAYSIHLYVCGGACYQYELEFGLIDMILNAMGSVTTTFIVNIILIIRHIIQRHRMKRSVIHARKSQEWRRSLKLSIQLISISLLYLISWMPYATIGLIQIFQNTVFLTYLLSTFLIYLPYCPVLFLPFICLFSMPDIKRKFYLVLISLSHHFIKTPKNRVHFLNENPPGYTTRPVL